MSTATSPTPEAEPASETTTLVLRRTLPASPERVFAAWTRPELVQRWMSPADAEVDRAEVDARVGGSYRIEMKAGEQRTHTVEGVYEQVVPNERLVFTWKWLDSDQVTRVRVDLRALGDHETELTLSHDGFADAAARDPHGKGWNGCLDKLVHELSDR